MKSKSVNTKKEKKTKKRKLKLGGLIVILLLLYIIGSILYYIFVLPVKNIYITGLDLVSEKEILDVINYEEGTPIVKVHSNSLIKKIEKLDLIESAKIKKSILGNLTIDIKENTILYYDTLSSKFVLSDGNKITSKKYFGYPTLNNYVPSKIEKKLINGLKKIDKDIIIMISEIEYSPDSYNDTVVDDERFILRMNDGNTVYINMVNIKKINKYQEIYASISGGGTLYLDSNSKNYIFKTYVEEEKLQEEEVPDES